MTAIQRRNLSFDFLRVFGIFYIIFVWHIQNYAHNLLYSDLTRTLKFASLSIIVFISGFVLTRKYDHFYTLKEAVCFLRGRFYRIYPLYLSALALFLASSLISMNKFISGALLMSTFQGTSLRTLWFIVMIFVFYFIFSILLHTYSLKRLVAISSAFILCCISLNIAYDIISVKMIFYYFPFAFGIACAKHDAIFKFVKSRGVAVISVLAMIGYYYLPDFLNSGWFRYSDDVCFVVFSISPMIVMGDIVSPKLHRGIIVKLSYASFCMYLYHRVIYLGLLEVYYPDTNIMTIAYLFIAGFPIMYLVSYGIQKGYDYLLRREKTIVLYEVPGETIPYSPAVDNE